MDIDKEDVEPCLQEQQSFPQEQQHYPPEYQPYPDEDQPSCEEQSNHLLELEAQMASLLSLHNATSDAHLTMNKSTMDVDFYTTPSPDFVSVIKFHGQPIPPPVLSLSCRLEMQAYKEAAVKKEQEMVSRRRHRLLQTVQGIVDKFEVEKQASRENSPRDATDIHQDRNESTQLSITDLRDANTTTVPPGLGDNTTTVPATDSSNPGNTLPVELSDANRLATHQNDSDFNPPAAYDSNKSMSISNMDVTLPGLDTSTFPPGLSDTDKILSGVNNADISVSSLNDTEKSLPVLNVANRTLPGLTDTEKLKYNQVVNELEKQYVDDTPIILQEIDDMLGTNLSNDLHASINNAKSTHQKDTSRLNGNVQSIHFSSDESALNRTVIPVDDDITAKLDTEESFNPPLQSTAVRSTSSEKAKHEDSSEMGLFDKFDKYGIKPKDSLRASWADSESNASLLGEYHSLPTPSPDINPELQNNRDIQRDKDSPNSGSEIKTETTQDAKECSTASVSRTLSRTQTLIGTQTLSETHSTQLTLDTVAQSCTLPSNLFSSSSSNSTLCEVQDPFASYNDENTLFESRGELTRGAPVGQDSSNTESGSEPQEAMNSKTPKESEIPEVDQKQTSLNDATSKEDFKSPRKRVRRNSYTLDHPSPALLDAKARNEAPYASDEGSPQVNGDMLPTVRRSLDLGGDKRERTTPGVYSPDKYQDKRNKKNKKMQNKTRPPSNEEYKDTNGLTEDNLLRLQMDQFEQIRKQLEEKQKRQLEEMLIKQQQEQLALQKEMAAIELRFNQQNSSQIYNSVFGDSSGVVVNGKERHDSDAIAPSLRDSLENALPPVSSSVIPYSHTSPSIHTRTSHQYIEDSPNHEAELRDSTPFYLEHDKSVMEHNRSVDLDYMDVEKSALSAWMPTSHITQKIYNPAMQAKFDRVSAVVKGYLTRRLMKTHKVQSIIQTIRDTVYFVDDFQAETPIKNGKLTQQDVHLAERLLSQLSTARNELYDTFQTLPAKDRMAIIAQSRMLEQQDLHRPKHKSPNISNGLPSRHTPIETKPLSTATLKALERKNQAKKLEAVVPAPKRSSRSSNQKATKRPKSVGDIRFAGSNSKDTKDPMKPKPVIHRHNGTNKNVTKPRPKSTLGITSTTTTTNTAANKKTKNVRRSLYPANPGGHKGSAKGSSAGSRTNLSNAGSRTNLSNAGSRTNLSNAGSRTNLSNKR